MLDNRYEFVPLRQNPRLNLETPYGSAPGSGRGSTAALVILNFLLRAGAAVGMSVMVLVSLWIGFFALICLLGNGI